MYIQHTEHYIAASSGPDSIHKFAIAIWLTARIIIQTSFEKQADNA